MTSLEFSQHLQHEVKCCDRFIRNRNEVQKRFLGRVPEKHDDIINMKLYSYSEETYKRLIAAALSLDPQPQSWRPHWPVRARSNPILYSGGPQAVLDLPDIRTSMYGSNTVDWSVTDYLSVTFPRCVYLWHCTTNRTLRIDTHGVSCLKWNPKGNALFMATKNGKFKFTDAKAEADLTTANCSPCHVGCFITSCAFHPTSPLMYIGCSKGSVCAYHVQKGLHIITQIHESINHEAGITKLELSSDGRHLAVANLSNLIFIYETMNYAYFCTIGLMGPSKALAWHPWKRSLLVVSDCQGNMALYNMLSPDKPEEVYTPSRNVNSSIMNLTFNPHSAELVVSQSVFTGVTGTTVENHEAGFGSVHLDVLSSLNRVVDRLKGHKGAVHFLNWSPDGTQLATAGIDETARLWDFLPSKIKQRTARKESCELNYVTASLEIGNRMGLAIR